MSLFRLLQLCDSGFPTGGFAHSSGLESATSLGHAEDVLLAIEELVVQTAHGVVPFARAVHDDPASFADVDARVDAFLLGHVARRASRLQGRAWFDTVTRVFDEAAGLREQVGLHALLHQAPVVGLTARTLGLSRRDLSALVLHMAMRNASSAAVRLSRVGPIEAQSILATLVARLPALEASIEALGADDAAQTAPFLDVLSNTHDRLYTRLFLT